MTSWYNFIINPFVPNAPFLVKVFWYFQEIQKVCIGNKYIKMLCDMNSDNEAAGESLHEIEEITLKSCVLWNISNLIKFAQVNW